MIKENIKTLGMSLFTVGLLGIGWAALMQEDDITVATPLRLSPNDAEVVSLGRRP